MILCFAFNISISQLCKHRFMSDPDGSVLSELCTYLSTLFRRCILLPVTSSKLRSHRKVAARSMKRDNELSSSGIFAELIRL